MPTITQPMSDDFTPTRRRHPAGLLARLASATTVLVVAGSVAIATGAIPDAGDNEVHLCYATGAAGTTPLSIYDAELNPTACPATKASLAINQQGPKGATGAKGATGPAGPKGATGPAGATNAYATMLHHPEKAVNYPGSGLTNLHLPAGSYVLSAKGLLRNSTATAGSHVSAQCHLKHASMGSDPTLADTTGQLTLGASPGDRSEAFALHAVVSSIPASEIVLGCSGVNGTGALKISEYVITAIRVSEVD